MKKKDILQLKEEVDDAKTEVARLEGRQEHQMAQLKKDWKCDSTKDAEKKVSTMGEEIAALDVEIDEAIANLRKKYGLDQ